jgi:hypothetical protein
MLKNIRDKLEKCHKDILELQKYCDNLMKEEEIISRKIKWDVMNNGSKAILGRMIQIDKNIEKKRGIIREKKLHLGQLDNKMKATQRNIT